MANQLPDIHAGSAALQNVLAAGQNLQAAYAQTAKTGDYLAKAGEIMFQQGKAMQEEEHRKWERDYKERVFNENVRYNDWNMAQNDQKTAIDIERYNDPVAVAMREAEKNKAQGDARKSKAEAFAAEKINEATNKMGGWAERAKSINTAAQNGGASGTSTQPQEQSTQVATPQNNGSTQPQKSANSSDLTQKTHQNKASGSAFTLNGGHTNLNEANEAINSLPNNKKTAMNAQGSEINKNLAAAAGNSGVALPTQKDGWA